MFARAASGPAHPIHRHSAGIATQGRMSSPPSYNPNLPQYYYKPSAEPIFQLNAKAVPFYPPQDISSAVQMTYTLPATFHTVTPPQLTPSPNALRPQRSYAAATTKYQNGPVTPLAVCAPPAALQPESLIYDLFVAVLAQGTLHEISLESEFTVGSEPVVMWTPFPTLVSVFCGDKKVGTLSDRNVFVAAFKPRTVLTFHAENASLEQSIVDLFNNVQLNPSAGALTMDEICAGLGLQDPKAKMTVRYALQNEGIFRTYTTKNGALAVVLQSHKKSPKTESDGAQALLLQDVASRLQEGHRSTVNTLFNDIRLRSEYFRVLAADFTTLKKFLMKANDEVVWFKVEKSTKIKKRTVMSQY